MLRHIRQRGSSYKAKVAKGEVAIPPARDLKYEALVEVLEGKRLVHAHCYRQDEILMLLHVADAYGFHIQTLQHVLEGYKVAQEIAQRGTGASTFADWWAYKIEANDAIPYNAAILVKNGVADLAQFRRCRTRCGISTKGKRQRPCITAD